MTKEELERLKRAKVLEEQLNYAIQLEETYFSMKSKFYIEMELRFCYGEFNCKRADISFEEEMNKYFIDAIKKYKLELQQQLNEL